MTLLKSYFELTKPRIVLMVLVTTTLGYYLAGHGAWAWNLLVLTLLGTGAATAGAAVLNNYLERDSDARMERTRNRALPSGLIAPIHALAYGTLLVLAGVMWLATRVNLLTGFLVLLAAFLYVLVYTPMKRLTWLNTSIGAIPGAIPPMAGWAAARDEVGLGAWVVFAVLFLWQHPHFYAIAWMYRDDYRRGGFKMLPLLDPDGRRTFRHIAVYSALLIVASILPSLLGQTGWFHAAGSLGIGLAFFFVGRALAASGSFADARRLLRASIIYLPIWLILTIADLSL